MDVKELIAPVTGKLSEWVEAGIKMVPNMLVAVFCLAVFWLLAILIGRIVHRMVLRLSVYRYVAKLTARLSRLLVILLGLVLAFYALHLNNIVASALAGIGIVGLAFGFAAKNTGADFLAGFIIHFTHPYRVGHLIQVEKFMGYVDSIDLRTTTIRTQPGQRVIIPNHKIIENELTNYYISGERRVDIKCGIVQDADLEKAEEVAIKAVKSLKIRNTERDVELFYDEIADSSINFTVRFWADPDQIAFLTATSQAIKAIQQTFRDNGIKLASPVTILDFSAAKGGSLREQLRGIGRLSASKGAKRDRKGGEEK